MAAKVAIVSMTISLVAESVGHIKHYRRSQTVVGTSKIEQTFAIFFLHIGGVNHCKQACLETFIDNKMQKFESITRCRLTIFIITDQAATKIRRNNLGRLKVAFGKSRLTRTGSTDKQH
ncbi:MAG: hypothetical protein BWY75_03079 [bacterium ADurb.Bin425]|nr:MAG: hypothetical protein BWY75_03079 [bacterium ADurb.Bin425]